MLINVLPSCTLYKNNIISSDADNLAGGIFGKPFVYQKEKKNRSYMYRVFISHSWSYSSQYDKIEDFLRQEGVYYYNHSIPKDDPIHTNGSDYQLEAAIESKVKGCSCVIILAGVYASYSRWIQKEIRMAKKYNKPIIAVEYWGAERTSVVVKNAADVIVKWNAKSVADAVRKYAINQYV